MNHKDIHPNIPSFTFIDTKVYHPAGELIVHCSENVFGTFLKVNLNNYKMQYLNDDLPFAKSWINIFWKAKFIISCRTQAS